MSEYSFNFSSISANLDGFRVKWENNGVLHRFSLDESAKFADLLAKIQEIDSNFSGELGYIDDEGDSIVFSSTVELHELIAICRSLNQTTIKIKTLPKKSSAPPLPPRTSPGRGYVGIPAAKASKANRAPLKEKELHSGIICDNCDSAVYGIRYKCITCDDYDLCENCEKSGTHPEHAMLRRATPRTPMPAFIVANRLGYGRRRPRFMEAFETRQRPKCTRRRNEGLDETAAPRQETGHGVPWDSFFNRHFEGFAGEPANAPEPPRVEQQQCPFSGIVQEHIQRTEQIGNSIRESFAAAINRSVGVQKDVAESQVDWAELRKAPEVDHVPMEQEVTQSEPQEQAPEPNEQQNATAEMIRSCIAQAYQALSNMPPPTPEAPPVDKLAYNAAQAAQLAVAGLATASDMLQRNVTQLARDVENPHFKEAMNHFAAVLASTNTTSSPSYFPGGPASTPANIPSPAKNTEPTTTPAEPIQEQEEEHWEAEMEVINSSLNVVNLAENHAEAEVSVDVNSMEESTHTAVEHEDDTESRYSMMTNSTKNSASSQCSPEMLDSMMQTSQMTDRDAFFDAPESVSPMEEDNKTSAMSDIEVISLHDDDDEEEDERDVLYPEEPRVASDGPVMIDSGDGWMVLNRGNYEDMCKFYEQQRRDNDSTDNSRDRIVIVSADGVAEAEPTTPLVMEPSLVAPIPVVDAVVHTITPTMEAAPQPPPRSLASTPLYPKLAKPCEAGTPYYNVSAYFSDYEHNYACPVDHPDPVVQFAVNVLVHDLGFDNCNGWLTRLAEKYNGEIELIIADMENDSVYVSKKSN